MHFDVAMPLTLFTVTVAATFLSGRVEKRLKAVFEEREFKVRDAFLFVAAISVAVSIIALIPQMAIVAIFLLAYSLLLSTFTYIFSDIGRIQAKLFCASFVAVCLLAGTLSLFFSVFSDAYFAYGALVLYCLGGFSLVALFYEDFRKHTRERWYMAAMPSILFIALYVFYNKTRIWFPYMLNIYGLVFAILIILYLGSLFSWKSSLAFAGLLTTADVILVLVTRTMVSAATHMSSLGLPVLVILPTIPQIITQQGLLFMSLGLGDFFFAGLLATQTYKKFGRNTALLSSAAMAVSFFAFEVFILNFRLNAFPGTLMILCGWLPVVLPKFLKN